MFVWVFHKTTLILLIFQIADYMNPDAYNRNGEAYRISNIYYDTENDQLIRASIEKPVYKEKLRLRAYGTPELTDNVFVEIKKKYISTICSLKFIFHMTDSRTLRKMAETLINMYSLSTGCPGKYTPSGRLFYNFFTIFFMLNTCIIGLFIIL